MIETDFTPRGVCSKNIHIVLTDDRRTVDRVEFLGGCNGNLKAIGKLVAGMPVDKVVEVLEGNTCGPRPTSCADQLTKGLKEAQRLVATAE